MNFKQMKLTIIILFLTIYFYLDSAEIDRVTPTVGASLYYTGLGLNNVGIPLIISGALTENHALLIIGICTVTLGCLLDMFVGPMMSIAAWSSLKNSGVIENKLEYNSGFWDGIGWASLSTGVLLLLIPLVLTIGTSMSMTWGKTLAVFSIICIVAGFAFFGTCVTIPIVKINI